MHHGFAKCDGKSHDGPDAKHKSHHPGPSWEGPSHHRLGSHEPPHGGPPQSGPHAGGPHPGGPHSGGPQGIEEVSRKLDRLTAAVEELARAMKK
jgi:hypothetical protein